MQKYGWEKEPPNGLASSTMEEEFTQNVKDFQHFYHLPETGKSFRNIFAYLKKRIKLKSLDVMDKSLVSRWQKQSLKNVMNIKNT